MRAFWITLLSLVIGLTAAAQNATSAEMEQQARDIGKSLRCVVCQNQSIEESDADLASDMRQLVRDRLKAGDSPEEVIEYIRERYGDYVLLKPPVQPNTWVLWLGPFIILLGTVVIIVRRQKTVPSDPPLSATERDALDKLRAQIKPDETS